MVSMRYKDKVVADFEQLVKLLPPSAVASPLRSTVPLVDFWRTPESRLAQLSAAIGGTLLPPIDGYKHGEQDIQDGLVRVSYPVHPIHPCEQSRCQVAGGKAQRLRAVFPRRRRSEIDATIYVARDRSGEAVRNSLNTPIVL